MTSTTINTNDTNLLKIVFDLKQEFASYKKETDEKIKNLENENFLLKEELNEKNNEINFIEGKKLPSIFL